MHIFLFFPSNPPPPPPNILMQVLLLLLYLSELGAPFVLYLVIIIGACIMGA